MKMKIVILATTLITHLGCRKKTDEGGGVKPSTASSSTQPQNSSSQTDQAPASPSPTMAVPAPVMGNRSEMVGISLFDNPTGTIFEWPFSERSLSSRTSVRLANNAIFYGILLKSDDPRLIDLSLIPEGEMRQFEIKDVREISCVPL